jgi:hypothetical protein
MQKSARWRTAVMDVYADGTARPSDRDWNRGIADKAKTRLPGARILAVMAAVSARRDIGLTRTIVGYYARIRLIGCSTLNWP